MTHDVIKSYSPASAAPRSPHAAIIGAGIGGLAASIRLAASGWKVTVYEHAAAPGGKAGSRNIGAYRFDSGPSLITMPSIFQELFDIARYPHSSRPLLIPLKIICRYQWDDGTLLHAHGAVETFIAHVHAATGESPHRIRAYLNYCSRIDRIATTLFLRHSLHDIRTYTSPQFWKSLIRLWMIDPLRTMHRAIAAYLQTPKMRQFFDRYATYNGSNPYRTPATFNIIPHSELAGGAWGARHGIYSIPTALADAAISLGVEMRYRCAVSRLCLDKKKRIVGLIADDHFEPFDAVISNADVESTYRHLLPDSSAPEYRRYRRQEPSSSGIIFFWGMRSSYPMLRLHNIFFSRDYRKEFDDIFVRRIVPSDPTIYLNIGSKITPEDAPPGGENWFLLINAPSDRHREWERAIHILRTAILTRLSRLLSRDVARDIVEEQVMSPPDIAALTWSASGSLYGPASHSLFSAFQRHPNRSRTYRGLYFCGGSVHPGGGMPLAALSGSIAADLAHRDRQWRRKASKDIP